MRSICLIVSLLFSLSWGAPVWAEKPSGEVLLGEDRFVVIEEESGHAFGFVRRNGELVPLEEDPNLIRFDISETSGKEKAENFNLLAKDFLAWILTSDLEVANETRFELQFRYDSRTRKSRLSGGMETTYRLHTVGYERAEDGWLMTVDSKFRGTEGRKFKPLTIDPGQGAE